MKLILMIMVALVAAAVLALGAIENPGYVLIGYGKWRVETTLSFLIIAMLAVFVVSYYTIRFIVGLIRIPRVTREWHTRRKFARARQGLNQGLIKLAEGDWRGAEKQLLKQVAYSDNPMLNYLAAARAAHKQGAAERRDSHLLAARESGPNADVAVGITQAELQISHRQLEQALATLTHLRELAPRNRHVLEMLMHLYTNLGDWNHLSELLPELHKRKVITGVQADSLEREVHLQLLDQSARIGDVTDLKGTWSRVPKRLTRDESLQLAYAGHLQKLGAEDNAEVLVRRALQRNWSGLLVNIYGQLEGSDRARQLAGAESWLKDHETDPDLLLSLGRLAIRSQLWGKAQGYLESSVAIAPTVAGYQLLANLLEQLDDQAEAAECYRKATMLASNTALPSPAMVGGSNMTVDADNKPALAAPA
ncbi:MAG: heme biosynthesis protein HemY [Gammaproteobacteria bacterium]